MKIVTASDTHGKHRGLNIPKGDIFIFAGDFEIKTDYDLKEMRDWLNSLDFKEIITIFGNHDFTDNIQYNVLKKFFGKKIKYLCNNYTEVNGLKIWGSSYSPRFMDWGWMKFDSELKEIWDKIPIDTDIVVTHCPCYGILDKTLPRDESVGSFTLKQKIKEIQPKIHICGHIHEGYGQYTDYKTDYYNVSVLDEMYKLINEPTIIEV